MPVPLPAPAETLLVPPDATEWLARHPEYATELKEFLATHNRIENLAAPVRQLSGEILNVGRSSQGGLAPPAPVSMWDATDPPKPELL